MRQRAALLSVAWLALSSAAFADKPEAPPVSPDRLRSASQEFDEGRRLFQEKQYSDAAAHFENAYHDAPSAGAIRAAVRARVEAKEDARAATLAAIALRGIEADAPTTKYFTGVVEAARPKLLELRISCASPCEVALDGKLVSLGPDTSWRIFAQPGAHQGAASFVGRTAAATDFATEGAAGQTREVFLVPKPEPPAPLPSKPLGPNAPVPDAPPPSRKPLSKAFFFTGLGLTVASGGATAVSGALAMSSPGTDQVKRDCAGLDASCATYQDGKSAELRTNILLGVTIGFAVVTTVLVFFTDFSGKSPAKGTVKGLAPGPGRGIPNGFSF